MKRLFRFCIFALLPAAATAQIVGQEPIEFNENLREQAEISGALIAGLQRTGGRPDLEGRTLHVEVPAHWSGDIACLRVTTSNGLYDLVATYPIPEGETLLPLRFPTQHADYLAGQPEGGVAALITPGDCTQAPTESAIIRWQEADDTPATLYLNAFRADRVYVYLGTDPIPVECEPLTDQGRTAYDVRCDLATLVSDVATDLEILSISNGQPSETAVLTLTPLMAR
jgi:hypothetical protein